MVSRRNILRIAAVGLVGAGTAMAGSAVWQMMRLSQARALYSAELPAPKGPLSVFHLGHSLVGRDMPAMLAQLAPEGHDYASQLGWGTPLRAHWEPDMEINGFEAENAHPNFRAAREALQSGDYGTIVFTEMVELTDAIRYHDSAAYLARWATIARAGRPDAQIYLYETWHTTDDPAGWLSRIDADYETLWLDRLALLAASKLNAPVYIIPGGQVMAAVVRAVEAAGGIGSLTGLDALMARTPEGGVDTIHLSDLGNYLIALTHYAALYQRSPLGLPLALMRADGTRAHAPDAVAGALMQQTVWDVVRATAYSGVSQ